MSSEFSVPAREFEYRPLTSSVAITAIHNRTQETITIPHQQRGPVEIEPGGTLEGPFIYTYDQEKEGVIPSPNQAWFVNSPHEFKWGAFSFPSDGP